MIAVSIRVRPFGNATLLISETVYYQAAADKDDSHYHPRNC